jgi:23S rRNA pseudouridine1911/1915/1917 synthase
VCELYPEIAIASPNPLEGGLVHRLDTGTSGCLVFARHPAAYAKLRHAFSNGLIEKTYLARVEGEIKESIIIDYPIAHHPKNKAKMIAIMPKNKYFRGKPQAAVTIVEPIPPLQKGGQGGFVRVRIQGGRRHQIRVHLAAIGHPLVGDVLYGAKPVPGQPWHALHAESVTLPGGKTIVALRGK